MNKIADVANEIAQVLEKHGVKGFVFLYDSEQKIAGVTESYGEDDAAEIASHVYSVFRDVAIETNKFADTAKEGVPLRTVLACNVASRMMIDGLVDAESSINRTLQGEHLGPEAEILTR